jgi:putative acetyltransferase
MMLRLELPEDRAAVHAINVAAFETPAEADLVDALREQATSIVSWVAEGEGTIIGHVMFSPVTLPGRDELAIMGLAPLAVAPGRRSEGVGSALVRTGLDRCRELDCGAVVVLGHPSYYPRFGFAPSVRFGIGCTYDAPEEAFMVVELVPGYLDAASGTIRFLPAFDNV